MDTQAQARDAPDIATPEEVLETFTQLLRSEKAAEQMKAAEQLAKYHGLFAAREEEASGPPDGPLTEEIDAAVRQIAAQWRQKEAADGTGGP